MSADQYGKCPVCFPEAEKANEQLLNDAKATYGKVSAEQYALNIAEAEAGQHY